MSKIKNIFLSLILVGGLSANLKALFVPGDFTSVQNVKTGIVDFSWTYPTLASDTTVYIQYNETGLGLSSAAAQIVFQVPSTVSTLGSGTMSLPVNVGRDNVGNPVPAALGYYFYIWLQDSNGVIGGGALSTSGQTAITTPAVQTINTDILANGATTLTLTDNSGQNSKLAIDNAGNTYVLTSTSTPNFALIINKITPENTIAWTRYYANDSMVSIGDIEVDMAGNIYVTGSAYVIADQDIFLLKYDTDGNVVYHKRYTNMAGSDEAKGIALDSTGNIYITGRVYGGSNDDMWLGKYAANGLLTWTTTYNSAGNFSDYGNAVAVDNLDNVIVVGSEERYDLQENANIFVRKYTSAGALTWAKTYNNPGDGMDTAYGVTVNNINDVIVVGSEERYDLGQANNIWLRKYDPSGNTLWTQTYDGGSFGWDDGYAVFTDNFSDIYVAGGVYGASNNRDLWIGKYDPSGNFMESKTYDNSAYEDAYDIAVSSIGKVFASAQFDMTAGIYMYSQHVSTEPIVSALAAFPGPQTGTVGLSWNYDTALSAGSSYYIQVATASDVVWSTASAQIVVSTEVASGMFQNEVAYGLITSRGPQQEITSPNYYFKAWTSVDGSTFLPIGDMVSASAKTPFVSFNFNEFPNGGGMAVLGIQKSDTGNLMQDANGDFYYTVGGEFNGDQGLAIQKYDANGGGLMWTTFYNSALKIPVGATSKYQILGSTIDANGYLYLAGEEKNILGNTNGFLGKFTANGHKVWTKVNGLSTYDDLNMSVAVSNDSNTVYVVGAIGTADSGYDIRIASYSSAGEYQGLASLGSMAADDLAYGIDVDASGNVYVTGETNQLGYQDIFVYKFDSAVDSLLATKYFNNGSGTNVKGYDIEVSADGNFVYVAGTQNNDGLVGKFAASDLTVISTVTHNSMSSGDEEDKFLGIALSNDGDVYVSGYETRNDISENTNILIKKYDADLNEVWAKALPTASTDEAWKLIIDRNNNDVLTGIRLTVNNVAGFLIFPAPSFGLGAMPGNIAGSVNLMWTSDMEYPNGATYFVQYTTDVANVVWSTSSAQIEITDAEYIPSGAYMDFLVPGLEVGLDAQNMMASPSYNFKIWLSSLPATVVHPVEGSPVSIANTPMAWGNSFVYPESKLFVTNGANNNRNGLAKDSSGNIYTVANFYDQNNGTGGSSIIVKKTTYDGVPLWTRFYGSPEDGEVRPYGITVNDSGVYISGSEQDYTSSENTNTLLLKYSPTGEFLWKTTHNGDYNGSDYAYDVAVDSMGFVYAAGSEFTSAGNNTWLGKYTSTGGYVWNWDINIASEISGSAIGDTSYSVAIDTTGIIWMAGSFYYGSNDIWIAMFDNEPGVTTPVAISTYGASGYDAAYDIAIDSQNYVYVVGSRYVTNEDSNIWLHKFENDSTEINEVWNAPLTYNDPSNNYDQGYGVAVGTSGAVYVTGSEARYDLNQGENAFMRKYSSGGDVLWTKSVNTGPGSYDVGYGVVVDNAGRVYVAGNFNGNAGFYRYSQSTEMFEATSNPTLTVNVKIGDPLNPQVPGGVFVGATVSIIPFDQNGNIDPTNIHTDTTNASGTITFNLPMGFQYFVGISTPSYMPSIKDQMMDPYGNFMVNMNGDVTRDFLLFPKPEGSPDYTLRVHISSGGALVNNEYIMGEVAFAQTGEKAAYAIMKTTDSALLGATMFIDNVPPVPAGAYSLNLNMPSNNASMTIFLDAAFPQVADYYVDLSSAVNIIGGYDTSGSTVPPSFECVVRSTTGFPLDGARIEVSQGGPDGTTNCDGGPCWQTIASYENKTDANGYASFYDLPVSATYYQMNVKLKGYKNAWDGMLIVDNTYSVFRDYSLELATYTLTGILKYNNTPIPNADIMVWGDWNFPTGVDSYAETSENGQTYSMQVDAQTKTGPDGSFTLEGLTDGNARLNASFYGSWMDLNAGNDSQNTWDDIRVTISSAGATTPANGNLCTAGSVWALDKDGICKSAGDVIFNIQPTAGNSAGQLFGDIIFSTTYTITAANPLVISTASPITIMAIQECRDGDCGAQNLAFATLAGLFVSNTTNYSVVIDTGSMYWTKVASSLWGKLTSFDDRADFSSTDTVRMDFTLVRSGGLRGSVKFPNGNNFKPLWSNDGSGYWMDIELDGVSVDVGDGTGLDEYGEFYFPNIAPGVYNLSIRPQGDGFIWPPVELNGVTVAQDAITEVKLQLTDGLFVKPQIFGLPTVSTPAWSYNVIAVESGEQMNQKLVTKLFFDKPKYSIAYSTSTGWDTISMEPGQYDFYLTLGATYDPGDDDENCSDCGPESYNSFANFIGRVKNKGIKKDDDNPNIGTLAQPIAINILGAIGQEQIGGELIGDRVFTADDYERIFANFDNELFPLIPVIMLYDTAGDLRGFSHALPSDETAFEGFWTGITNKSSVTVEASFDTYPSQYLIWGLPAGNYTAVFVNPNYPPVAKEIVLPGDASYNFDFDAQDLPVGTVSGIITSSVTTGGVTITTAPIENVMVYLKHRTIEKFTKTDSLGAFSFANVPPGTIKITVSKNGYVKIGDKMSLAGDQTIDDLVFVMLPSESVITGRVYLKKFPSPATKAGISIVAYDETLNVNDPTSYIPKMEAQTDDNGDFEITGIIPGHIYKVSAFYTGKLPEPMEVTAVEGSTVIDDIVLKDVPPQIILKIRKSVSSDYKMDVIIRSPKELVTTPVCTYNSGITYSSTTAVSLALIPGPNHSYLGQFTVSSDRYYTLYVTAGDGSNKMSKYLVYDKVSKANTDQYIQSAAIAGGEVYMDSEQEEYTGIELDPGAVTTSSSTADYSNLVGGFFSALPSVKTVKTDKGEMSLESAITNLMASEVYDMDLTNAQPNKPFSLNLKYNKERALNSAALKIYQYKDGEWKEVPGSYTVDPMIGTVSVDIASVEFAYEGTGDTDTPLGRKKFKMSAISPRGTYVPSAAGSSQSGQFAVFTAKPDNSVVSNTSSFKVYNMPNPFNLKSKSVYITEGWAAGSGVTAVSNANTTTSGTIIKYHLPAGKGGSVKFVIYNVAGEKVRTLDEGQRVADRTLYSDWDGKNDRGTKVASGVYFMLTYLDGEQLGNKAHKMAIIK
jgi:carboxypeptidase family protein